MQVAVAAGTMNIDDVTSLITDSYKSPLFDLHSSSNIQAVDTDFPVSTNFFGERYK